MAEFDDALSDMTKTNISAWSAQAENVDTNAIAGRCALHL
jgi:hypothetical protein